jgi:hypothetical protein
MKKLLVLLIVAMGLFSFSTGAFAQLADICAPCDKCLVGSVGCPTTQGGACGYFDFETGYGYSSGRGTGNCHAVFSICNCLNAGTTFIAGHRIGIRLTILVNGVPGQNGAYWSDPASANIQFRMFATQLEACQATSYGTGAFGPGKFFKTLADGKSGTEVTTLIGGTTCTVPPANQATQIVTNPDQGYLITLADETAKTSRWWVNIPEIRIDPAVLNKGEKISVKIETLDQSTGGICADCVATCECVVDVAYVCPSTTSSSSCIFPYFTSTTAPNDTQLYWNGIAITNTGSTSGTATLTVKQQDGATGTYTTPSIAAGSIWVKSLDQVPFTGSGLGNLPIWIKVTSTFGSMDGFAIIADTSTGESMGYLCRKP